MTALARAADRLLCLATYPSVPPSLVSEILSLLQQHAAAKDEPALDEIKSVRAGWDR